MMRAWLLLLVVVLVACGGYVAAPDVAPIVPPEVIAPPAASAPEQTPAPVPTVPPVATPAPEPAEPPASAPVIDLPAPGPTWVELWREDWAAPSIGGTVRHSFLKCAGRQEDPNQIAGPATIGGNAWGGFGGPRGATFTGSTMVVDDLQHGAGWALLSGATFDHSQPIRLTGVVDLLQDPGAWMGLTLIQDESDYRELALRWRDGELWADLYAPCYLQPLARLQPGPRLLALDYHPQDGWSYWVDGALLHTEPIPHAGAALMGRPRIGVYIVNVEAEGRVLPTGRVRATVGPLRLLTP